MNKAREYREPCSQSLVRETGIEPARLAALDPKSSASASSATPACIELLR